VTGCGVEVCHVGYPQKYRLGMPRTSHNARTTRCASMLCRPTLRQYGALDPNAILQLRFPRGFGSAKLSAASTKRANKFIGGFIWAGVLCGRLDRRSCAHDGCLGGIVALKITPLGGCSPGGSSFPIMPLAARASTCFNPPKTYRAPARILMIEVYGRCGRD
jgi:hypothetical protein